MLLGLAASGAPAFAQMNPNPSPPPPQQAAPQSNPMCVRLEGQLATIDRGAGSGDPAKDEQIRRYQDAAAKQQAELDRVTMQAKRTGCDSPGFFSLFNGQSEKCGPVNTQIQQMRGNLDQITSSLERLRSGGIGGADRENQRRSVLTALAQNNCGPQYAAAARGPGNFIDNLFGNNNQQIPPPSAEFGPQSGTFRTVCVRTCDGAYFPVSFATVQARFPDDEKILQGAVPGDGSDAVQLPQPRRRHQPGGLDQRPALLGAAERIQVSHRVQSVLRLQGRGANLVRRAEIGRRQSRRRTAGRHHRHRGKREEDAAARAAGSENDADQKGRCTRRCDGHLAATCNDGGRSGRNRREEIDPHRRSNIHPAEAIRASVIARERSDEAIQFFLREVKNWIASLRSQ